MIPLPCVPPVHSAFCHWACSACCLSPPPARRLPVTISRATAPMYSSSRGPTERGGTGLNGGSGFTLGWNIDDAFKTNVKTVALELDYVAGALAVDGGAIAAQMTDAAASVN